MGDRANARPACQPVGAKNFDKQEERKRNASTGLMQVVDGKTGRRIGVLVACRHGFLAFGAGFASLVQRGGVHKHWRLAVDALTEHHRHA